MFSVNPDGSDRKVIVHECRMPDGIAVDVEGGHIYWTNMGVPNLNDGSIERADLDGRNRKTIVPQGGTFTPKQLQLDKQERQAVLVATAKGCASCARTSTGRPSKLSWRRARATPTAAIRRSGASASPSTPGADKFTGRKKARMTRDWAASSAPISKSRPGRARRIAPISKCCSTACPSRSIWSSISRIASSTGPTAATRRAATPSIAPHWMSTPGQTRPTPDVLITHLMEGIGIAIDFEGGRMFLTDLAGSVYSASLDGSDKQTLLYAQGNLTGIAYAELPSTEK